MRRIQVVVDKVKIGTDTFYEGDVRTLPYAVATNMISQGWAKDSITGEVGTINTDPVTIEVHNAKLPVGAT